MAAKEAFLRAAVLDKNPKPGIVKVVRHVEGPLDDGSLIREVADSAVYIKAIFTKKSQDTFQLSYEDSFNSQPEWDHGLLLLNKYCVEFQSSFIPVNRDKRPRFVLVVERFGLFDVHAGFYSKTQPKDVMADQEVRAKAYELEKQSQVVQCAMSQDSEVSLSLLLEQLGEPSQPDPLPSGTRAEDEHTIQDRNSVKLTLESACELVKIMKIENFLVSPDQQALLDLIPEWRPDYVVPAVQSLQEQQTGGELSSAAHDAQHDFLQCEPTLRSERIQSVSSTTSTSDSQTTSAMVAQQKEAVPSTSTTSKADGVLFENQELSKVISEVEKDSSSSVNLAAAHKVDSQPAVLIGSREQTKQNIEKRTPLSTRDQQDEAGKEPLNDVSDTSESPQGPHPDVSFSASSCPSSEERTNILISVDQALAGIRNFASCSPHSEPISKEALSDGKNLLNNSDANVIIETHGTNQQKQRQEHLQDNVRDCTISCFERSSANQTNTCDGKDSVHDKCSVTSIRNKKHASVDGKAAKDNSQNMDTTVGNASSVQAAAAPCDRTVLAADVNSCETNMRPVSGIQQVEVNREVRHSPCSLQGFQPSTLSATAENGADIMGFGNRSIQGFVPTNQTLEDLVPKNSCCTKPGHESADNGNTDKWFEADSQNLFGSMGFSNQSTQSFVPTNQMLEDLVPKNSCCTKPGHESADNGNTDKWFGADSQNLFGSMGFSNLSTQSFVPTNQMLEDLVPKNSCCTKPGHESADNGNTDKWFEKDTSAMDDSENRQHAHHHLYSDSQLRKSLSTEQGDGIRQGQKRKSRGPVLTSTPKFSSDESPSQTLLPIISLTQQFTNSMDSRIHISVLEMDKEENLRLATLEETCTSINCHAYSETGLTLPGRKNSGNLPEQVESSGGVNAKSQEGTDTTTILANYSDSDTLEDSFDFRLMQAAKSPVTVPVASSGETNVIPESSQECVIVLSSSTSSSQENLCTCSSKYHRTEKVICSQEHASDRLGLSRDSQKLAQIHKRIVTNASVDKCNKTGCDQNSLAELKTSNHMQTTFQSSSTDNISYIPTHSSSSETEESDQQIALDRRKLSRIKRHRSPQKVAGISDQKKSKLDKRNKTSCDQNVPAQNNLAELKTSSHMQTSFQSSSKDSISYIVLSSSSETEESDQQIALDRRKLLRIKRHRSPRVVAGSSDQKKSKQQKTSLNFLADDSPKQNSVVSGDYAQPDAPGSSQSVNREWPLFQDQLPDSELDLSDSEPQSEEESSDDLHERMEKNFRPGRTEYSKQQVLHSLATAIKLFNKMKKYL